MIVPISKIKVRRDEDGVFIAKSELLPGCHAHGRDRGEAILRFQQAAKAHLEALMETGRPIPPAFRDKFILAAALRDIERLVEQHCDALLAAYTAFHAR